MSRAIPEPVRADGRGLVATLLNAGPSWSRGDRGWARVLALRWGVPVVASAAAGAITFWLQPVLAPGRFLLFLTAVVMSAGCGGFPAGLVATALGALGHAYLSLPESGNGGVYEASIWYGLAVFIPAALLVSGLIGALHAARHDAHMLAKALHERVQQLVEEHRCKDDFLAMLAHELRNPLGTAAHALRVLQIRDDRSTVLRARAVAERQFHLLARLVDDLLDRSRVVRGKLLLHRERIDLVRLVGDTLQDYAAGMQEAGLVVERDMPDGSIWVEGDRTRLAQVLGNLLHNASKFTDPGGTVAVRLARDMERRRALVRVNDTGIGMEPSMLKRLFQDYAQEERGRDHTRGGLGLGLALVKALVELHGGAVEASSDGPGCGARFSFWLPLSPVGDRGEPAQIETTASRAQPLCVLIIEDNRDAAETLKMLIGLSGHDVAVAHSSTAGIALARQLRPDVILCDLGLPCMDGLAVARRLRQETATTSVRLIALTGFSSDEDRRYTREAGFDDILVKPVEWTELERLLAGVLQRGPAPCS